MIYHVGRLPACNRRDMDTLSIMDGNKPTKVKTKSKENECKIKYITEGILAETLLHESSHTSLDGDIAKSEGWMKA